MSRYLVTGGAGFIGSHIAVRLVGNGHDVRILDDLSTGRLENLEAVRRAAGSRPLDWIKGSIVSSETCRQACEGVDYVLHQAALASVPRSIEQPEETTAVNVVGTVTLLAAARKAGVKRVVLASSSSVYGDAAELPKHESMLPAPRSPYAASKLAGEQYARVFATTLGLPTVSLRYFNVFGPRQDPASQYAAVVPLFITALLQGRRPVVFGDGTQSRDFTFVDNVVDANLQACVTDNAEGEAINIACGERYTLLDLLDRIGRILGVRAAPEFQPPRPGDVRHSQAAIERARQWLRFEPKVTFEDGLLRTINCYRLGA